jgi:hypothetical protein
VWRILILAMVVGLGLGVARARWDVGAFDATKPLRAFDFPAATAPDYWQPPAGRRAKAAFDALRYEFGKLEVGRTMRHAFRVTNEGDYPLVLAERESSCVCTAAELAERPIPPGESAEITLQWSAPPQATPGEPYRQWTTIETNDPERPIVTLFVEGELAAPVAAEMPTLAFGTVAASQRRTLSTWVLSYRPLGEGVEGSDVEGGNGLAIVSTEFDDPATADAFDVRLEPLAPQELGNDAATAGWRLSATTKPGLPQGPFHQTIRLRTNLADGTSVAVSLVGEIGPDVFVTGPGYSRRTNTLTVGRVDAAKGIERQLTLVAFAPPGRAVEPSVVETAPRALSVEIRAPETGENGETRWPLVVRVGPFEGEDADAGPTSGKIAIETTHAAAERIEIAVKLAFSVAMPADGANGERGLVK